MTPAPADIPEYLAQLPSDTRAIVVGVLDAVRRGLPGAEERVRYGMPAVMLDDRYAIHLAGWKHHVGIYPVAPLPAELEEQIAPFRAAKDALHLRYADPVPHALITRMAAELRRQRLAAG